MTRNNKIADQIAAELGNAELDPSVTGAIDTAADRVTAKLLGERRRYRARVASLTLAIILGLVSVVCVSIVQARAGASIGLTATLGLICAWAAALTICWPDRH